MSAFVARLLAPGAKAVQGLTALAVAVQEHQSLTHRQLSGDAFTQNALPNTRQGIQANIAAVKQTLAATPELEVALSSDWQHVVGLVQPLIDAGAGQQRDQAFAKHQAAHDALRRTLLRGGEDSGLLLDPDADTYVLPPPVHTGWNTTSPTPTQASTFGTATHP